MRYRTARGKAIRWMCASNGHNVVSVMLISVLVGGVYLAENACANLRVDGTIVGTQGLTVPVSGVATVAA